MYIKKLAGLFGAMVMDKGGHHRATNSVLASEFAQPSLANHRHRRIHCSNGKVMPTTLPQRIGMEEIAKVRAMHKFTRILDFIFIWLVCKWFHAALVILDLDPELSKCLLWGSCADGLVSAPSSSAPGK